MYPQGLSESNGTYDFEQDGEHHEEQDTDQETIKRPIVSGTDTVGDPGTVMIVDTNTTVTDFTVSGSFRFDYLNQIFSTLQSKHISVGLCFSKIWNIEELYFPGFKYPGLDVLQTMKNTPTTSPNER